MQGGQSSAGVGAWLFRWRGVVPLPGAVALVATATSPGWGLAIAGLALVVLGEGLRLWGVAHIGAVSRTRSDDVGALVESGPYRWSRNPLYAGNLILWCGVGLLAGQPLVGAVVVLVLFVHYSLVIAWEEENLQRQLGERYAQFRARVARWIGPGAAATSVAPTWVPALRSERSTFLSLGAALVALLVRAAL